MRKYPKKFRLQIMLNEAGRINKITTDHLIDQREFLFGTSYQMMDEKVYLIITDVEDFENFRLN